MASTTRQGESSSSSSSEDWRHRILIPTILAGVAGGGVGLVSKHRKVHGLANISATYAANFAIVTGCYCEIEVPWVFGFLGLDKYFKGIGWSIILRLTQLLSYMKVLDFVLADDFGACEFVRVTRKTGPDDLMNSAIAGFGTGALLGRLQVCIANPGGQLGAYRYSIIFAAVGTAADFAALKLRPKLCNLSESMFDKNSGVLKLPEWSPIQVLDEEALAAKQAREEKLLAQRALGKLSKEES
ncbi:Mitochondrial import inner membrane translocase subunit Tim17/Tim22/Tim23 family protein, putative [Theobroma cacao]|uniref:Mitochondrial import inner membrane translocase subunit Tim17/Tim22/Tim23 family protein, putative n=1 Tax=Theobroma cacao TaxID=3641 RepID=A0A061DM19_THECC|nr:Mitochondrial import inner membrane translocase subunit Tim17/Tim22/Tim23 family protein, putative [Theobroma cacao]